MATWELKELGDVAKTGAGGTPLKSRKEFYEDGNIPWLLSGEVAQGEIYHSKKLITQEGLDNSSAKLFPVNSVLVAMYGATAGQVGILKFEASTNQAVCGIFPNDNFIPEFSYYFFLSKKAELLAQAVGNAQPNISQAKVKKTLIPVPPLAEQKQIVALLDQAFTAIDKAQANIETNINNAKELFQSKLNDIFSQGWEERTLGEACVVERGSSPRPIKSFITDSDDGVNWIKIGDVGENDKYVRTTKQKITKEGAEKSRFVDIGDFILSNSMSFGRAYIMAIQGYIHDGWFVLRIPKEINSDYFWQLLSSPYLKNQFNQLAAGAIVKNISGDLVKKAIVPIPPLEKQIQIYEETDLLSKKIEEVVTKYETKLQNLEELKKSILQKAFNGELTNHQPNIIPFPQKVENISTTELHAGLIALAFKQHLEAGSNSFHHVKSEKIIHMLESYVGIDLERVPTQDAAGPNDYPRVKSKIEHRAKMAGYFYVNQTPQGYYQYSKGNNFDALVDKTCDKLGDKLDAVLQMIKIMVELDTKMAEILATVYAAWNNLIIDNKKITDEAIVSAARENWHDDKLNIPRKRFFKAINWMKKEGIVPKGLGKKVEKKET